MNKCWCNKGQLITGFSENYALCDFCQTLVFQKQDNNASGSRSISAKRQHFLPNTEDSLKHCIYWLKTLLKYKTIPIAVFDMSAVQHDLYAILQSLQCEVFQVHEHNNKQLFDVILLINVLEHYPDPKAIIQDCLKSLKPDGLLLIKIPHYSGSTEENIHQQEHTFVSPLVPQKARYLFNQASIQLFLKPLNLTHIEFQYSTQNQHDMLLVASRAPLVPLSEKVQLKFLHNTTAGSIIACLINKQKQLEQREKESNLHITQIETLRDQLQRSEADRAARLTQIEILTTNVKESESKQAIHSAQIDALTIEHIQKNTAHLANIEKLTATLKESDDDRAARLTQIKTLSSQLASSEHDRALRLTQVETLTVHIKELQQKHTLEIEHLHTQLAAVKSDATLHIEMLIQTLQISETERTERVAQIKILHDQLETTASNCSEYLNTIETQVQTLQASENNRKALHHQLYQSEKTRELQLSQLDALTKQIQAFELHHTTQVTQLMIQLKTLASNRSILLKNLFNTFIGEKKSLTN